MKNKIILALVNAGISVDETVKSAIGTALKDTKSFSTEEYKQHISNVEKQASEKAVSEITTLKDNEIKSLRIDNSKMKYASNEKLSLLKEKLGDVYEDVLKSRIDFTGDDETINTQINEMHDKYLPQTPPAEKPVITEPTGTTVGGYKINAEI